MYYLLKKEGFNEFVEHLIANFNVVAPVMDKKDKMSRFSLLKKGDSSSIVFEIPQYPVKDFFFPIKERLFDFTRESINATVTGQEKTVFLMNRCDVNAVHRNDLIMLSDPVDPYYKKKRDSAVLVELPCVESEKCRCVNIGLIDCYDLKLIDSGKSFIIDAANEKGEQLIQGLGLKKTEYRKEPHYEYKGKEVKTDNKGVWDQYAKDCFSCSACTAVCPTCICFTIEQHLDLDCASGHNHRRWASCQLQEFTKVAGGFTFRKERGARGKQRIHCKFIYFKEKFGYPRCVGCGRCNAACPVGINIYKYFEELK